MTTYRSVVWWLFVVGSVFVFAVLFTPDIQLVIYRNNSQLAQLSVKNHLHAELVAHKVQLEKKYTEFKKEITALKTQRTEQHAAAHSRNDMTNIHRSSVVQNNNNSVANLHADGVADLSLSFAASLPTLKVPVVVDDVDINTQTTDVDNNVDLTNLNATTSVSVVVKDNRQHFLPSAATSIKVSSASTSNKRGCERQALLHGHSLQELRDIYLVGGSMKWGLMDSFVMRSGRPCGSLTHRDTNCSALPVVVVVLSPLVYKEPPYQLGTKNAANRQRQKDYDLAMNNDVHWTCEYSGGDLPPSKTLRVDAMPTIADARKHSAIIRCPAPPEVVTSSTDLSGRLLTNMAVKATPPLNNYYYSASTKNKKIYVNSSSNINNNNSNNNNSSSSSNNNNSNLLLHYAGINPCDRELVPSNVYLGVCTAFAEPKILELESIAMWTRFMLDSGAGFVALYLDPTGDADAFERQVHAVLQQEVNDGDVVTVMFRMDNRRPFQTQQAQENHCQWRFRGKAQWLAQLDVDEFFQPLGKFSTLKSVLETHDDNRNIGALKVRHRFWDHHPVLQKNFSNLRYDVWNMIWRDNRETSFGREKTITKPELVDYIDVHTVGTGRATKVPCSETQLRLNHFKRQFSGYDEGHNCSPTDHVSLAPIASSCFNASHPGNIVADLTFQEYYNRIKGSSRN